MAKPANPVSEEAAAVAYWIRRDWPSVVIFTGYCLANTGFLAIELSRK